MGNAGCRLAQGLLDLNTHRGLRDPPGSLPLCWVEIPLNESCGSPGTASEVGLHH